MRMNEQNMINIYPDDKIIILDDNDAIHDLWNDRFYPFPEISVRHFLFSGRAAFTYLKSLSPETRQENVYLFCDYQPTPDGLSGLELIQKFKVKRSLFVTDHHDSQKCIDDAIQNNILILPKDLVKTIRFNMWK